VREKTDQELLDHYSLAKGPILTNRVQNNNLGFSKTK
jgi:hypothetical protein